MSRVVFSKYAKQELEDAIRFYDLKLLGLGMKFKNEVRKAVLQIVEYPHAWSIERGDVRKCLLYKFPYKILYSVEDDHIFVIAVAHQHQKPNYWVGRNEI